MSAELLIEFMLVHGSYKVVCCGKYRSWHHFNASRDLDAMRGWDCRWARSLS